MDDHGQIQLARERHLLGEHGALHVARGEVVVEVEPDLADGAHERAARHTPRATSADALPSEALACA